MTHRATTHRQQYYWIVSYDQGKPYLIYGGTDEEQARQKGMEVLGGLDFQVKRYPTRDLGTASAFFRGKRLDESHSLRDARQRIGHDKSIARLKKKKQRRFL